MAKVPVIDLDNSSINTESSQAKQDPSVASNTGSLFFKLGKGMEDISAQLEKAHTLAEVTKAENAYALKTAEIKQRAMLDTDTSPEGRKKYHDELMSAASSIGESISLPYAKNEFSAKATSQAELDKFEVDGFYRKRVVDQGKANAAVFLDAQKKDYISSNNMAMKERAILRRDMKIDQMVESGFISREGAVELKQKMAKEWPEAQAQNDAYADPNGFLEREAQGYYKGVDAKTLESLRNASDRIIQKQFKEQKIALAATQNKTEQEFGLRAISGQLPISEINDAEVLKKITPKYANILREYQKSEKTLTVKTDIQLYNDVTDELFSLGVEKDSPDAEATFEKIASFRAKVTQGMIDGRLTKEDGKSFLNQTADAYYSGIEAKLDESKIAKKSAWDFFGGWANDHAGKNERAQAKYYMAQQLISSINNEEALGKKVTPERVSELSREILKRYIRSSRPATNATEELPHGLADKQAGFEPIYSGDSKIKGQRSVTPIKQEYTDEDLQFTAEQMGMTIEEVKEKIEGKSAKKPTS